MAVVSAPKVDIDTVQRLFIVTSAPVAEGGDQVVNLDIKIDLYSDAKEVWVANEATRKTKFPIVAVGGQALPGTDTLGTTFFMDSGWSIRPYEASHRFKVNGNLYKNDGTTPFLATLGAYNVFLEQKVSNLVDSNERTQQEVASLKYLLESVRSSHAGFGVTYYVDPTNGDDALPGTSHSSPLKTLQAGINACRDGYGDTVVVLARSGSPTLTVNESLTINKSRVNIRGPGHTLKVMPMADVDAVTITGSHVELSGMMIMTAMGSTNRRGVVVNGSTHTLLQDLMVMDTTGDGIIVTGASNRTEIRNVHMHDIGAHGIHITGSTSNTMITDHNNAKTHIGHCGGDGIRVDQADDTHIHNAILFHNTGWGINTTANASHTYIGKNVEAHDNSAGAYSGLGTETHVGHDDHLAEQATAVGDRVIEGTFTADQIMRLMAAVLLGKSSNGAAGGTFRDLNDTTDRVISIADASGNRSSVTLTP